MSLGGSTEMIQFYIVHTGNWGLGRSGDSPITIHLRDERFSSRHQPSPMPSIRMVVLPPLFEASILLSVYDGPGPMLDPTGIQWERKQTRSLCSSVYSLGRRGDSWINQNICMKEGHWTWNWGIDVFLGGDSGCGGFTISISVTPSWI